MHTSEHGLAPLGPEMGESQTGKKANEAKIVENFGSFLYVN